MPTAIMPEGRQRYHNNDGTPAAGAKLYTYAAGTSALKTTYSDEAGTVPNPNPITLDAKGEAVIYWDGAYKVDLKQADQVQVTGYPVDNIKTDPGGLWAKFVNLATSAGGSLVGFILNAAGAVARTVQDKLREQASVLDFGADPTGAVDSTAKIQAALNSFGANGGRLRVPAGTYKCSAPLTIPRKVTLHGDGRQTSWLQFTHAGDGLRSTWPINSSTGVFVVVRDLGLICINAANTGGGFVDVGGTFVDLVNVYVGGFMYEVIFDQTEIATITDSHIEQSSFSKAGIWLVNGADHVAGVNPGFTNRVTVRGTQFNAATTAGPNVVDDGGGPHVFRDNNFNAGSCAVRAAGVANLVLEGNECEGHTDSAIVLTDKTAGIGQLGVGARYVGPCSAPRIDANTITDGNVGAHVVIDDCQGGSICGNLFGQVQSQNILFNNGGSNKSSGLIIEGNTKLVIGQWRQAAPFVGGFSQTFRQNTIRQNAVTYGPTAQAAGGGLTVIPATMEYIRPNTRLWCINQDGTNGELVLVKSVGGGALNGSFVADFATSKAANFLIYGCNPADQEEGAWTPTLFGSGTAGANTYSSQIGYYSRRGNRVTVEAIITMTAKDAAMAGQLHVGGLPFKPANSAACAAAWATGWTAAGYTQLNGDFAAGTPDIALLLSGSGMGLDALTAVRITSVPFTVKVSGTYITDAL